MTTKEERKAATEALKQQLAAAKARSAAAKAERERLREVALGDNGKSVSPKPVPRPSQSKEMGVSESSEEKPSRKKKTEQKEYRWKPSSRKSKVEECAEREESQPVASRNKKRPTPVVIAGLSHLAEEEEEKKNSRIDEKTGLTEFQVQLVKLVERGGKDGVQIQDIIQQIWSKEQIELAKRTQKNKNGQPLELPRAVRNAIRRCVSRGFVERVDGQGLYRFKEWKSLNKEASRAKKR